MVNGFGFCSTCGKIILTGSMVGYMRLAYGFTVITIVKHVHDVSGDLPGDVCDVCEQSPNYYVKKSVEMELTGLLSNFFEEDMIRLAKLMKLI